MRQKYEREIEEILERLDDAPPAGPTGRVLTPVRPVELPPPRPPRQQWTMPVSVTPAGLVIAALVLAVVSAPLPSIYPPATAVVGLAAVGFLIAALVMSVTRASRSRATPMWRGREMPRGRGFLADSPLAKHWRRWRAHRRFRDPRWD